MDEKVFDESDLVNIEEKEHGFARFFHGVGRFIQRIGTRNLVVIASLMLIGTAVILNYTLFGNSNPTVSEGVPLGSSTDAENVSVPDNSYFASAQLSRQQARDQAISVLQTVVESASADDISKEQATLDISRIVAEIETEANIETLIRSKGFEECVAVLSDGGASVIVRADGLLPNELSQIKEIVWEQAGIDPVKIKIIEKS